MRIANLSGRLILLIGGRAVDVEKASEGRFESHPQAIYARWAELRSWAVQADLPAGATVFLDASVFIHHFEPNALYGPPATEFLEHAENCRLGLLINFGSEYISDGISRVVNGLPSDA